MVLLNSSYCGTGNFAYTEQEFNQLYAKAKSLAVNNAAALRASIKTQQMNKIK